MGSGRAVNGVDVSNQRMFLVRWEDPPQVIPYKNVDARTRLHEIVNEEHTHLVFAIDELDAYTQTLRKYGEPK